MQRARRQRSGAALALACLAGETPVHAGMTVYGLKDVYRLRFEEISFFVFLLLGCSWVFQMLWNHGTKGFGSLPRLRYLQALCLSVLFGLAMLLILTMISGIREVLTPGAWRRQGTSYRLNDPAQEPARLRSLEHLRSALLEYARTHEGHFPASDFDAGIAEKLWESPDPTGTHYLYTGALSTNDTSILAVEPASFGEPRLVLMTSGAIDKLGSDQRQIR